LFEHRSANAKPIKVFDFKRLAELGDEAKPRGKT
jgi:hypothetical protein